MSDHELGTGFCDLMCSSATAQDLQLLTVTFLAIPLIDSLPRPVSGSFVLIFSLATSLPPFFSPVPATVTCKDQTPRHIRLGIHWHSRAAHVVFRIDTAFQHCAKWSPRARISTSRRVARSRAAPSLLLILPFLPTKAFETLSPRYFVRL